MIEATGNDLVVIASDPNELAAAQHATIEKVAEKIRMAEIELRQAKVTVEAGSRAGINIGPVKRLVKKAEDRLTYLQKVKDALNEGCVIVPNFPGETVAVRVKRATPRTKQYEGYRWEAGRRGAETPDNLPTGEGRYVTPIPKSEVHQLPKQDNASAKYLTVPTELNEAIGLPVEFLRPTVVERTGKCMARRIFDEIAVNGNWMNSAAGATKGDPMVLGRIIDRSRPGRVLTFLIAWFVDTSTI